MELGLKGKKALVTGGSHGIGLAIVNNLREEGCEVISLSRREGCDLTTKEGLEKAIAIREVDILVNNVGGGGRWKLQDWQLVYDKNVTPMFLLTYNALPYMLQRKWGRVITVSSIQGKEGGGRPPFAMAKAAQIAFMKSLANAELDNITFNTVCPGPVCIEGKEQDEYDRYGQSEDVAGIVTFLCSDRAKWINGASIVVDGGYSRSF